MIQYGIGRNQRIPYFNSKLRLTCQHCDCDTSLEVTGYPRMIRCKKCKKNVAGLFDLCEHIKIAARRYNKSIDDIINSFETQFPNNKLKQCYKLQFKMEEE